MDARKFACEAADYGFGLKSKDQFADQLVKLADEIRSQRIIVSECAALNDYCLQEIKIVVAPRVKDLYGPDSTFPVAMVEAGS